MTNNNNNDNTVSIYGMMVSKDGRNITWNRNRTMTMPVMSCFSWVPSAYDNLMYTAIYNAHHEQNTEILKPTHLINLYCKCASTK